MKRGKIPGSGLRDGIQDKPFIVDRYRNYHCLPQPESPLQRALQIGSTGQTRRDVDPNDIEFASLMQQSSDLPTGESKLFGDVALGTIEVVVELCRLHH
jgi:hypothetical protein